MYWLHIMQSALVENNSILPQIPHPPLIRGDVACWRLGGFALLDLPSITCYDTHNLKTAGYHMLKTYEEFTRFVDEIGFMTLSDNPAGWPSLASLTEQDQWFTDGPGDPWKWRVRIVEERRAAYAKVLYGLPSFFSREWYPLFVAARRDGGTFGDAWELGLMRDEARRIYELFSSRQVLATHEIKQLGGFTAKSKSRFEGAMTQLQAGMFLTTSGMTRMTTLDGRPHSWPVTEYRRVEDWAWEETMELAARAGKQASIQRIADRMLERMPGLNKTQIGKFIGC